MSSSVVLSVDMPIIAFDAATGTVFRIVSFSRPSTGIGCQFNLVRAPHIAPFDAGGTSQVSSPAVSLSRRAHANIVVDQSFIAMAELLTPSQDGKLDEELAALSELAEVYLSNCSAIPHGYWVLVLPGTPPTVRVDERRDVVERFAIQCCPDGTYFLHQHHSV